MNTKFYNFKNTYSENDINTCANDLKNDNIGIFPTDTVYGIGCNCLNINSIMNIYKIKKRNLNKPINILISNLNMLKNLVKEINPIEQKLIDNFWPGDLTIIFNKSKIVPDILTSGLNTVGIRMPNNKICLDLIDKSGIPLATSSANISNEPPTTCINENLKNNFYNNVSFIIDGGKIKNGLPSTIVRVENNKIKIIREGTITFNKIMEVIENAR